MLGTTKKESDGGREARKDGVKKKTKIKENISRRRKFKCQFLKKLKLSKK